MPKHTRGGRQHALPQTCIGAQQPAAADAKQHWPVLGLQVVPVGHVLPREQLDPAVWGERGCTRACVCVCVGPRDPTLCRRALAGQQGRPSGV